MTSASNTDGLVALEAAVERLSETEYGEFRKWFLEHDWETWDRQIEADSAAGRLDFLVREARDDRDSGKLRNL